MGQVNTINVSSTLENKTAFKDSSDTLIQKKNKKQNENSNM